MYRPGRRFGVAFGEHVFEMARHRFAYRLQADGESLPGRKTSHPRQARSIRVILRQVVALRVVEVLQPVLDVAQQDVGVGKLARGLFRKKIFL